MQNPHSLLSLVILNFIIFSSVISLWCLDDFQLQDLKIILFIIIIIFSSVISFLFLDTFQLQDLPSQELLELPSSHEKVKFFIHLAKLLQTQLFCIICKIGSLWHSAVWKWDFPVHQQQSLFVACNFDKDRMTIDLNGNASKDSKHRAQACKLLQNGL